ncbi:MAG: hypothetical protein L6243_06510 [Candidatus Altiarchaeales archaeon]|nr:hypothetical protein [Candidatus Altiarchaeales archaeon]
MRSNLTREEIKELVELFSFKGTHSTLKAILELDAPSKVAIRKKTDKGPKTAERNFQKLKEYDLIYEKKDEKGIRRFYIKESKNTEFILPLLRKTDCWADFLTEIQYFLEKEMPLDDVKEIHWWQFPLTRFSLELNDEFKRKLIEKIEREYSWYKFAIVMNTLAKRYGLERIYNNLGYLNEKKYMPAWIVYECCSLFKINPVDVEREIKSYRSLRGTTIINKPKLPLKIDPIFDSIVSHIFFDGHVTSDGTIKYTQKHKEGKRNYDEKVKYVFGELIHNHHMEIRSYLPPFIHELIKDFYGIGDFSGKSGKLPDILKNKSKLTNVSILFSAIADEGCFTGPVEIGLESRQLLEDLRDIAINLGYSTSSINSKLDKRYNKTRYRFYTHRKSFGKMLRDLEELRAKYPAFKCHKLEKLKFTIQLRRKDKLSRKPGISKQNVINELQKGSRTVSELAVSTNISRSSMRRLLCILENDRLLERGILVGKGKRNIWKLNNSPLTQSVP